MINQLLMDKFIEVLFIGIGIDYFKNIVCLKSDYIWIGQYYFVEFFDFNKKEKIKLLRFDGGFFE